MTNTSSVWTPDQVRELLDDAARCARLTEWENEFVEDLQRREVTILTEKQFAVLQRIQQKVYDIG